MEKQLYIRVRGRVLGPYDQEKLRSLARRGQLSRLHELSEDAANWVRASTFPDLFARDDPPAAPVNPDSPRASRQAVPLGNQQWWYRKDGSETGPVDQAAVERLLAAGRLGADDVVWSDGMPQWTPARQVPGLLPAPTVRQGEGFVAASGAGGNGELPAGLCKSAANSRPWMLFVATIAFIHSGAAVAGGIGLLIAGANLRSAQAVAVGLFCLIWGVDVAAGGFLLSSCAGRVGSLRYSAHPAVLEKAMDSLHTLWVYVSVNLIVFLTFAALAAVSWVAVVGTLPWFPNE